MLAWRWSSRTDRKKTDLTPKFRTQVFRGQAREGAAKLPISCVRPIGRKIRACMGADVTRFARVDFHSDERVFGIKDCSPSALMRQIGWVEEGRISGSS